MARGSGGPQVPLEALNSYGAPFFFFFLFVLPLLLPAASLSLRGRHVERAGGHERANRRGIPDHGHGAVGEQIFSSIAVASLLVWDATAGERGTNEVPETPTPHTVLIN